MVRKGKRNIGDEILQGLQAMKAHYEGKITLRTFFAKLVLSTGEGGRGARPGGA